jgi:hypothetical protein
MQASSAPGITVVALVLALNSILRDVLQLDVDPVRAKD